MPCTDGVSPSETTKALSRKLDRVEAMLCGVLTALELSTLAGSGPGYLKEVLRHVDYEEGGFTKKDILGWWKNHKLEDKLRRAEEKRQGRLLLVRQRARNKLTAEEREALGV